MTNPKPAVAEIMKLRTIQSGRSFVHWLVNSGVRVDRETGERFYCRHEVYNNSPWKRIERRRSSKLFEVHKPKTNMGIFIYHNDKLHMYHPQQS